MMAWAGARHLPVTREGTVVGVLSERDPLRHGPVGRVGEAMSSPPEVIGPEAAARMVERRIGCLPVVEAGLLVGIVTATDLLDHLGGTARTPTVDAVMSRTVLAVTPATPVLEAAALLREHGIRHLSVVDPERRVVGIISDRDVRLAVGDPVDAGARARDRKVTHIMTHDVVTVPQGTRLAGLGERLVDERVGAVPVVDSGGRLVGMVSYVDLIRKAALALETHHGRGRKEGEG